MADPGGLHDDAAEPRDATARLTGEMQLPDTTSAHPSHDTLLVASLADHSLDPSERAAAEALVASCGLCAALHADLIALRAATRAMPTPARPRDFRLTPEDAARARPSGWRRLVAAFGTSRDAVSRPLAVGLTTLGIVGLLAASIPSMLSVGGASSLPVTGESVQGGAAADAAASAADRPSAAGSAATGAQVPAAPVVAPATGGVVPAAGSAGPVPLASGRYTVEADGGSAPPVPAAGSNDLSTGTSNVTKSGSGKGAGSDNGGSGSVATGAVAGSAGIPPLVLLSGALLTVGLAMFVLRWGARRFGD